MEVIRTSTKKKCTFVKKLESLIEESANSQYIRWNEIGTEIQFEDTPEFQATLKNYFNVQDIASFIRQLNIYRFKRTSDGRKQRKGRKQKKEDIKTTYSFKHPDFVRDRPELREYVKRNARPQMESTSIVSLSNWVNSTSDSDGLNTPTLPSGWTHISEPVLQYKNAHFCNPSVKSEFPESAQFQYMADKAIYTSYPNSYDGYVNYTAQQFPDLSTQCNRLNETCSIIKMQVNDTQLENNYTYTFSSNSEQLSMIGVDFGISYPIPPVPSNIYDIYDEPKYVYPFPPYTPNISTNHSIF